MPRTESARVLITVKASPEPSSKYGDTVCVAGIRLDTPNLEWIRLYPIPYRYMEQAQQFSKYDVLELNISKARNDPRPESFTPHLPSIKRIGVAKMSDRSSYILPLVARTMCEVQRDIDADLNGPSLAVVRARVIKRLSIDKHPGWTPAESQRLATWAGAPDLFGTPHARELHAPRLRASYVWICASPDCKEHTMRLLDWELVALQRKFPQLGDAELAAIVRINFLTKMFPATKTAHFYVGNFAAGPKRKSFSILGTFPSALEQADMTLF